MEKYLVPQKGTQEKSSPKRAVWRERWQRSLIELKGRFEPKYRHHLSSLLIQSYSQTRAFPHFYHVREVPCETHINRVSHSVNFNDSSPITKQGISALEFDSKGVYLASVTKSGCLTVHDFDTLYCHANDSPSASEEDESKHLVHISLPQQLDAVRWNPSNQDEVACTSSKRNDVLIFDISYVTPDPFVILKTRPTVTLYGSEIHSGLTDIAFTPIHVSRLFASDKNGLVNIWDRRMGDLPCLELATNSRSSLNSIQLHLENEVVFGAGRQGIIYMWDLRGGRASSGFWKNKEAHHSPVASWKIASMLEKIGPLKAQSDIISKEVHSIGFDPSCPYQMAFHLDDGWSGVLDTYNVRVTHVHCPPPAWLSGSNVSTDLLCLRKPSWISTYSIYVVGSTSENGINLLDFYPDPASPCHVDYREDAEEHSLVNNRNKQNRFIPLSESVTACAAHPLNGTIVAGTKLSSLLVVFQQKQPAEAASRISDADDYSKPEDASSNVQGGIAIF